VSQIVAAVKDGCDDTHSSWSPRLQGRGTAIGKVDFAEHSFTHDRQPEQSSSGEGEFAARLSHDSRGTEQSLGVRTPCLVSESFADQMIPMEMGLSSPRVDNSAVLVLHSSGSRRRDMVSGGLDVGERSWKDMSLLLTSEAGRELTRQPRHPQPTWA